MFTEFLNMACKFTSMVEDTRKQELMSRKTARQSLAFDSPPRQAPKFRREHFTPPRHGRVEIPATQLEDDDDEDFERDSLAGASQTGSTRIRLQERWRIIGTRDKLTNTPEDIKRWLEEHATAEMAKAGLFEDLHPKPSDVGGWKRAHVSNCTSYNVVYFGVLIRLLSVQAYKSTTERTSSLLSRTQYNCPYRRTC